MMSLFFTLLPLVLFLMGLRIVRQQSACVVETFGRFSRVLTPGLNWIVPFVQTVVAKLDLRVMEIKASVDIKSLDNVFVSMPVAIMVQIEEARADDAYYKLSSPREQVKTWVLNTLRSSTANMKLSELFEDRAKLEGEVREALGRKMSEYGYTIVGVLVDQPSVSPEVQASFNRVVSAIREREAAEQEAEAKRIRVVGEARAESEGQKLRAEGLSQARIILSESLTKAAQEAVNHGMHYQDLLALLLETNRLETIRHAADAGQLIILDTKSAVGLNLPPKLPLQS